MGGLQLLISIALLLVAVSVHEYAHGLTAFKLGDPTAKHSGRLTLNPIAHIDPVGTILVPLILVITRSPFLFAWAKPVPVNFYNLHNPKRDMLWVGLAGPAANFAMAVGASVILRTPLILPNTIGELVMGYFVILNLLLGVFNLVPVPPLDGSRILFSLLPDRYAYAYGQMERFGMIILLALIWLGFVSAIILPIVFALAGLLGVR